MNIIGRNDRTGEFILSATKGEILDMGGSFKGDVYGPESSVVFPAPKQMAGDIMRAIENLKKASQFLEEHFSKGGE